MPRQIVVVEQRGDWKPDFPKIEVVLLDDYLTDPMWFRTRNLQVINLCRSSKYLSAGYYCSLLAEARGHRVIPTVRTMLDLSRGFSVDLARRALDKTLNKKRAHGRTEADQCAGDVEIFFGQTQVTELKKLAQRIFETFPAPLIIIRLEPAGDRGNGIASIRPMGLHRVTRDQRDFFSNALTRYLGRRWRRERRPRLARYDMAILHNPHDPLPPSDERALRKFIKAGEKLGMEVDLVTRKDLSRLGEYDALFIRDTTRVAHYTFRFAKKAESQGIVVIDDPTSILRCTNKVYLAELLRANGIPAPKTVVVGRHDMDAVEAKLAYPMVLKMPEGAFSSGVFKVEDSAALRSVGERLFRESELILAQAYTYTPYDWRIGVLDRQPLYACQYLMSKAHWQIVKHHDSGGFTEGGFKTWSVDEVPAEVVDTALKAAGLIGDGLYGVDLKQTEAGVFVIEVNDNPSIDAGVEDKVLKGALYDRIMAEFIRRIESQRAFT